MIKHDPAVLCVNDSWEQLELLEVQLRQAGYRVLRATDGLEGFEVAKRERPDLIVSDVRMPHADGIELCRAIRADAELSATPIMLVSALRKDTESVVEGLSAGADEYLEAPYSPMRMIALAARLVARKQAEDALRESEERYRCLVEFSPEAIIIHSEGKLVFINTTGAKLLGAERSDQLLGRPVMDFVHADFRENVSHRIGNVLGGKSVPLSEEKLVRLDGTTVDVEVAAIPFTHKGRLSVQCLARDITERKRIEAERQVINEIIQGVSTTHNLDELLTLIHSAIARILYAENCFVALYDRETGLFHKPFYVDKRDSASPPQRMTKSCTAYVFREGRPLLATSETFQRLLDSGKIELIGTPPAAWMGVPLRTPSEVIGVLVVQSYEDENAYSARDLEFLSSVGSQVALAIERKRGEEKIARLIAAVEQTADSIIITDAAGTIQYVNPAFERVSGFTKEEAIGRNPRILKSGKTSESVYHEMWATLARGEVWAGHLVNKHKDGSFYQERVTISPVRDDSGEVVNYIAVKQDLTQQKQLEEQLLQSQKMDSVGRLAGGVAHDFNNLLVAINGYSDLTLRRLQEGDPLRRNIEEIKKAGERAAALTRQLLAFSRKQVMQPKVLSVNDVVSEMDKMLRRVIGEDIELVAKLDDELGYIKADPNMLEQVVLNLCVNSRDAMPRGGRLTVETSNVFLDSEYAAHHVGVRPGAYVTLAVSDTGCGMDAETRARIFEPFFTTKEKGKGTGLGLSTVYGIVQQSGGHVWVYSEVGRGTTVRIYLPRVDEVAKEKLPESDISALPTGTTKILLVEDDEMVRLVAREIISSQGYSVLEAATKDDALRHCAENPDIALLLTDVVMPQVNGKELAEQLTGLLPRMRVLFMSGYTETVVHNGVLDEGLNFIQKPFTPYSLLRKIQEVLDGEGMSHSTCEILIGERKQQGINRAALPSATSLISEERNETDTTSRTYH
jgi:two-component system cell cycle sensor histidine kinase/response regulator CckA